MAESTNNESESGNKNLQEQLRDHPLWGQYQETLAKIRTLRPDTEAGDPQKNLELDKLEGKASVLVHIMADDLNIPDPWGKDPTLKKWDELAHDLQIAFNSGRHEEVETIFGELRELLPKVEAIKGAKSFSPN